MSQDGGGKMFYGIRYSPPEDGEEVPASVLPFDASLLKDLLKKHKALKPRFKIFRSQEEALAFANENEASGKSHESFCRSPPLPVAKDAAPSGNAECPYPSLSPQDLSAFRKDLESSSIEAFSQKIMANPRYLVSVSTDTPSIIHSGTRSNALHTCAKVGDPHVLTLILETLESQDFLESLYPKESEESRKQRGDHLLDNYINLPLKGQNETPLHIASKYANLSVIKILVSYSQCFINPLNKFGETPEDVACSRAPDGVARKSLIIEAIRGRVYIPIYRSLEYGGAIGEPWSPSSPSKRLFDTSDFSPIKSPYRSPHKKSPLVVLPSVSKDNYSLCDGPRRVSGLLGPISPLDAPKLKKEWKMSGSKSRLNDPSRGFEKQGREIAKKYGIDWREYWEFLDAYVDFSSKEGLVALEDYLEDMSHQLADQDGTYNLSYGFDELEIGPAQGEDPLDNVKSPMSLLTEEFEDLSLSSPSKPLRNPLISHFNRNIKREKQSFYNEVNSELVNISDQMLSSYMDFEDDSEDTYHLLMSVFSLPLSVFKRKLNNWRLDNRPFYCEESTLLQNLSLKICSTFTQELQKDQLDRFMEALKSFPISITQVAVQKKEETLNDSYRSGDSEDHDESRERRTYDIHPDEVLPFVASVFEGFTSGGSSFSDMNANDLSSITTDRKLTQTKDIFQNLSLKEEESSDEESVNSEDTFLTAESEWDRESFETAPDLKEVFIYGKDPSQTDMEVYLALEAVDTFDYPHISSWRSRVEEYDLAARGGWPSKTKNLEESLNLSKFDLDVSLDQTF